MKKLLISMGLACVLLPTKAQTIIPASSEPESSVSLNGTWNFTLDNGKSGDIKVPGNWDMQGYANPVYGMNREPSFTKNNPSHDGVYKRTFTLPDSWRGKQVWIAFDGVENGYTLYINGDSIGSFHSAFNRSMFDISKSVKYGYENQITVKVTQTGIPYWQFDTNDDWVFGGISRDVTLYAIPQNHITDIAVSYDLTDKGANVNLSLESSLKKSSWQVELFDKDGNKVSSSLADGHKNRTLKNDEYIVNLTIPASNAHLWSAESPYLYTLRVSLLKGRKVEQTVEQKIGIRTVSWQDNVFRINGVNVKLKGVDHHDESPVNGRAITEAEMLKDLRMMKAANINAIRCSHYPPSPHFMDMLDSLGFYAIDEVPYGFGDNYLSKVTTLPELKKRAWHTVQRDKNRPSVVIWSVGNENPITDNGLKTAHYVLALDPTRPNVFPNTSKPFEDELKLDDDSITMYSKHYPTPQDLHRLSSVVKHPLVNTECAHALGLDLGMLEGLVKEWYEHDELAGGCVWEWADQGLLRHDKKLNSRYAPTEGVWPTQDSYYDMMSIYGTDGIVYPDRYPQTNYYEVRASFSPIVIKKDSLGKYNITNRYDFTNLTALKGKVEYFEGAMRKKSFDISLDVQPHATKALNVFDKLPKSGFGYAVVTFTNGNGDELYKQSFKLGKGMSVAIDSISKEKVVWLSADSIKNWMKENLLMRIGRKPSLSSVTTIEKKAKEHHVWSKYLLSPTEIGLVKSSKATDYKTYTYEVRFDCDTVNYVDGTITVRQSHNNVFSIEYSLKCHGEGEALEAGVTLRAIAQSSNVDFRFLGKGPFACYPRNAALSWYGAHHLQGDDIYFPGNRMDVCIAMLQDKEGRGVILVPREGKNVCVERNSDGTINLNHSVHVSSLFNKNVWAEGTANTNGLMVNGSFDLYLIHGKPTPYVGRLLFGNVDNWKLHKPYFNSYDQ